MRAAGITAFALALVVAAAAACAGPSTRPWSVRAADSVLARHPHATDIERRADPSSGPKWSYSVAFLVQAIAQAGVERDDAAYVRYARDYMAAFVDDQGAITTPTYRPGDFKLDDVAPGPLLLMLHRVDGAARWLKAADALAAQLDKQPRTSDGGFWHKQIYAHQMWLDGIFMAAPFMAEYARVTHDPRWSDEAAREILIVARHARDPKTGLYFHGWDESRSQRWADPQTGRSPSLWARGVGWYAMGIVQVLEQLPADHPRRGELVALLADLADAIGRVQDPATGVWFQVLDQPARAGNYRESSASCMFVFALAKGVRLGLLDPRHLEVARRGYAGILRQFVDDDDKDARPDTFHLKDTCQVAGLGGTPYRDGSFDYYVREPRVRDDPKGLAPFILASLEMERPAPPGPRARTN